MPRVARKKSITGIYHVIVRGVNRQDIFQDDHDRYKFIKILRTTKEKSGYNIFAYCLMTNHIHLLLKEGRESISLAMKRISSSYVYYYNLRHKRSGHLFQERFKSEPVNTDSYFLTVLRYIHQNPKKASLIEGIKDYKWSSYIEYINSSKLIDSDYTLGFFSNDKGNALQNFIAYNNIVCEDNCLEDYINIKFDDFEAKKLIMDTISVRNITEIRDYEKDKRDELIKEIKSIEGLSLRQIARITGLSYNIVLRG